MNLKSTYSIALAAFLAAAALFAGDQADAQEGQALAVSQIGVVNIDAIRANSEAFKKARAEIMKYNDAANAALQKENDQLSAANEELNRKRTLLAPEAFAAERKSFEQSVAEFQRKLQEQQKSVNQIQVDAIGKINAKIAEIVTDYAKQNNLALVLPAQGVVLRADSMSMDAYVLERLNKELPSVTVSLPAK